MRVVNQGFRRKRVVLERTAVVGCSASGEPRMISWGPAPIEQDSIGSILLQRRCSCLGTAEAAQLHSAMAAWQQPPFLACGPADK